MGTPLLQVRSAALTGFPDLVRELGADPGALFEATRIEPGTLDDPDRPVLHAAFVDLLELAAVRTRRPDFGLLLAQRQNHAILGPVGVLIRQQPDVRRALAAHARYLHLHAEGIRILLEEHGGCARVVFDAHAVARGAAPQMIELALAVGVGMLRVACGSRWSPEAVYFSHAAPARTRAHAAAFRAPVHFDREFDGIEFPASVLDVPLPDGDANVHRYIVRYVEQLEERHDGELVGKTRSLIRDLLATGRCSEAAIARMLGMDVRTLQRRLELRGARFRALLDEVRAAIAAQHLSASDKPLSEIAELLGYSELSAFTRSFRRWFDQPPSAFRAARRAERSGSAARERSPQGGSSPGAPN